MSFKRPRTPTRSSSSSSLSPTLEPTPKSSRTTTSSSSRQLLCTLPPTCNPPRNQPTQIANSRDLETHYATYHAHVCESKGCGCVFPDAKLLELHQTECHDPIAALRKDRGEKIFACHLPSCPRLFSSPKTRRLHLIDTHSYPKEYFFAVTNKGIGGLLKKWGDGVSMLRGEWKDRDGEDGTEDQMDADDDIPVQDVKEGDSDRDTTHTGPQPPNLQTKEQTKEQKSDDQLDSLTSSMTSLSLVPPSIRFGRGGKSGGFGNAHLNGQADVQNQSSSSQPAGNASANIVLARGRGRGRGRGFVHPPVNRSLIPPQGVVGRGGGFAARGEPAGRAGIINVTPGRGGRGRGAPRGRGGRGGSISTIG